MIQEIVAEAKAEANGEAKHEDLLAFLQGRFGPIPPEVATELRAIRAIQKLKELVDFVPICSDLQAFRARMQACSNRR